MDITTRIPTTYRDKEMEIRNLLFQTLERGKVDFTINIDFAGKSSPNRLNASIIESYCNDVRDISEKLGIPLPADWFSTILLLPEAIKTEISETDEEEWNYLKAAVESAVGNLLAFRTQEGKMLEKLFIEKINAIKNLSKQIETLEQERIEIISRNIVTSLQTLDIQYDKNRFEQELIYYIDRLDVNEEKNRLANHLKYFLETLSSEKSQGRKLGFIAQEIGREINTLGSKSNHAGMQKIVVQMKDELEQIKEQILNVL